MSENFWIYEPPFSLIPIGQVISYKIHATSVTSSHFFRPSSPNQRRIHMCMLPNRDIHSLFRIELLLQCAISVIDVVTIGIALMVNVRPTTRQKDKLSTYLATTITAAPQCHWTLCPYLGAA